MMLKLISLFCILKSIYALNVAQIIYPPDPSAGSGRIMGGSVAPDGKAPYQCSIQLVTQQMRGYHTCGCAIISDMWILTAAHCVERRSPDDLEILVGTNDLSRGGSRYSVERFIIHEKYDKPEFANDIALIQLEDPISFDAKVQPIPLETKDKSCAKGLLLTGWGVGDPRDRNVPRLLQMLKLNGMSHTRCKQMWASDPPIVRSELCTVSPVGEGPCKGDSGGPLVLNNKLVGLVSFGMPCGRGYPDVFTKVSSFIGWIGERTAESF